MNIYKTTVVALALGLGAGAVAFAADHDHKAQKGQGMAAMHKDGGHHMAMDADTMAAMKAAYPMDTCVVSGDELGGGGMEPFDYVYKQEGKPDRLIRFCCKDCLGDFKKDPEKYLQKLDEAAAKKKGHMGHMEGHSAHANHAGHEH